MDPKGDALNCPAATHKVFHFFNTPSIPNLPALHVRAFIRTCSKAGINPDGLFAHPDAKDQAS